MIIYVRLDYDHLIIDCIMALEQIVYTTKHHFIVTLSPNYQPLIWA